MIDTLARLVRAYSSAPELPALLVEVAELALSCGGADQAAMLAREALYYLPPGPSATRGRALRDLGAALMGQGQAEAGFRLLEQAVAMAAIAKTPEIGASALCQGGLYLINHGDYLGAEHRFRRAIELLSETGHPHLLGRLHHNLALSLLHQGKGEAERHAMAALALRSDPESHLAEEDRMLLATLREVRHEAN